MEMRLEPNRQLQAPLGNRAGRRAKEVCKKMSADVAAVCCETSKFWPVAIGFFGLGTGYLVGGSQALFKYPTTREVDKSVALWCFWMSGFMQFITGVILAVGLTWFGVFKNAPPLYMAGVA